MNSIAAHDADARVCVVTGASGFLGQHLTRALAARGWRIRALSSRAAQRRADSTSSHVEFIQGSLSSTAALRDALRGAECVFHLAGEKRDPAKFTEVNVEGTRRLVQACTEQGGPLLVHVSSVGVVGPPRGRVVDETAVCRPQPGYEATKHAAEGFVLEYRESTAGRAVILRPANVFGDGDPEHHLLVMMRAVAARRFPLVGRREAWVNYVYAGDVAEACVMAAERSSAASIYQLADPCTIEAFATFMASELGAPLPLRRVPAAAGYLAGLVGSAISSTMRHPCPVNLGKVRALRARTVYAPARMRLEHPGWPVHGWQTGLRKTIASYRAEGVL